MFMMFRGNNFVGRSDARSVCGRAGPLRVASVVALLLSAACTPTGPSPAPEAKRPSLAQTELVQADGRAQICTAANAAGVGLRGEYFQKAGGKGELLLSRIDPTIDFDANLEWPQDKQTKRPQSIRWSGWIKPPLSGSYRVHVSAPGAKLTLANTEFSGLESADGRMDLAAGRFYSVRIEMDLPTSGTVPRVRLEWTAPHGARYVIPRPLLYQPTETSRSTGS